MGPRPQRALSALVVLCAIAGAERARGLDFELATGHRFLYRRLPEEVLFAQLRFPTTSSLTESLAAYQGWIAGSIRGRPTDALGLVLGIDSGLIEISQSRVLGNGKPIGEHAKETLFLGETYADLQLGETGVVAIRAGKLISNVGRSAIFDAYALGLSVDADLSYADRDNPWRFRAEALLPDSTFTSAGKRSPLFELEVGHRLGELGTASLFGSIFYDGGNGLSPLLADAVFRGRLADVIALAPRPGLIGLLVLRELRRLYADGAIGFDVESEGVVGWTGATIELGNGHWQVNGSAILGLGEITAQIRPNEGLLLLRTASSGPVIDAVLAPADAQVALLSGLLDLSAEIELVPELRVGGFFLLVSGDDAFGRAAGADAYHAFIALSPRLDYSSIFFNGGVSTTLASPTVSSIAPDGAGLWSVGLHLEILLDALRVRPALALMSATHAPATVRSGLYGVELDLAADYGIDDHLGLMLDAGLFLPGNYYGDAPAGGQILVGITAAL
ncbi:MAG: hypothetical protein IT384_12470 [Deltaproteobacteria bacterium]|nr:hypothetical protein [Deltaproteobacteria bacterium]